MCAGEPGYAEAFSKGRAQGYAEAFEAFSKGSGNRADRVMRQRDGESNFQHYLQLKKVQVEVDQLIERGKNIGKKVKPKGKSWTEMTLQDYVSYIRDNYLFLSLGVGVLFMDYKKLLEKKDQQLLAGEEKGE